MTDSIFCGWLIHHLTRYSSLLPLQLLKEIHARSNHYQSALSSTLDYLATGNGFEDLTFINATYLQSIEDVFTAQQTDNN
jgi:hypothetical protein